MRPPAPAGTTARTSFNEAAGADPADAKSIYRLLLLESDELQ